MPKQFLQKSAVKCGSTFHHTSSIIIIFVKLHLLWHPIFCPFPFRIAPSYTRQVNCGLHTCIHACNFVHITNIVDDYDTTDFLSKFVCYCPWGKLFCKISSKFNVINIRIFCSFWFSEFLKFHEELLSLEGQNLGNDLDII